MGDIFDKSWSIALKIWLLSVTLISFIVAIPFFDMEGSMLLLVFAIGLVLTAMYSLPLFFILFILLILLARMQRSFVFQMIVVYATGILGALAVCWIVSPRRFDFIFLVAPLSGEFIIFTQTNAIKKLMQPEILVDELLKTENNETELV